jgi:hypothetical protein
MKWFPSFGFQRRKRELQEEIDAHLQMAVADRVARLRIAQRIIGPLTRKIASPHGIGADVD